LFFMRESALLAHIYERSRGLGGAVVVGPGDDAAVLRLGDASGAMTLATVDQLVEGRHYDAARASIASIAHKAVGRALSDIAAMGGSPRFGLACATLRDGFEAGDELIDAMARVATRWGCPLVGGDIAFSNGPMTLSVTALGEAHPTRGPVLRSEARVGDMVYMTGALGGAVRSGRHMSFTPRLEEGSWLCDKLGQRLGAMIDLSDGLGRDAARLASASGVRIELEADALPLHHDAGAWREAIAEGEDYELLFTVSQQEGVAIEALLSGGSSSTAETAAPLTPVTRIGWVVEGVGCGVVSQAGVNDVAELGWDHGSA